MATRAAVVEHLFDEQNLGPELVASGVGDQGFVTRTASMGTSRVNLDRALQLAADLEDDELLRQMRTGS